MWAGGALALVLSLKWGNMKDLFKLRGSLPASTSLAIQVIGAAVVLVLWHLIVTSGGIKATILPPPLKVLKGFGELWERGLLQHIFVSLKLNLLGYIVACAVSLPLGFVLGLYPMFEALSERLLSTLRFLPLPAAMGIFIAAFGISTTMKVMFLAGGIIVYLLPTVVVRVRETATEHVQAALTLGARDWFIIRKVFVPSVLGRVWDDLRVLTAISWTYVTIVEPLNAGEGGLGAVANSAWRSGNTHQIYAVLVVIMALGWFQDLAFKQAGYRLFRYRKIQQG